MSFMISSQTLGLVEEKTPPHFVVMLDETLAKNVVGSPFMASVQSPADPGLQSVPGSQSLDGILHSVECRREPNLKSTVSRPNAS